MTARPPAALLPAFSRAPRFANLAPDMGRRDERVRVALESEGRAWPRRFREFRSRRGRVRKSPGSARRSKSEAGNACCREEWKTASRIPRTYRGSSNAGRVSVFHGGGFRIRQSLPGNRKSWRQRAIYLRKMRKISLRVFGRAGLVEIPFQKSCRRSGENERWLHSRPSTATNERLRQRP